MAEETMLASATSREAIEMRRRFDDDEDLDDEDDDLEELDEEFESLDDFDEDEDR
jgi:hypothetical protein